MFQLVDLIATSPIGVFLVRAADNMIYAVVVAADCDECGFNDLGKLLFGGLLLALLFGITISLLYRRKREKDSHAAQFVSIRSMERED